jgi:multidrug efflux pump subunit AcrA (membrane-fusion protein)
VKLVGKGQKVRVRADANRDILLEGEVVKIAVLPNSENRWMSPDLKVYKTEINIGGTYDWLKPGMSAQVEIVAGVLKDVVHVPLQAVFNEDGERVVYVSGLTGPTRRVVETGEFNDSFIEVKSGVTEGEVVLLRAPEHDGGQDEKDKDKKKDEGKAAPIAQQSRLHPDARPSAEAA